jgi:hypothetical protein
MAGACGRRWFVLKDGRATALRENRAFGAPTDDPLNPSPLAHRFERYTNCHSRLPTLSSPFSRWRMTYSFEPNRCEVEG